MCGNLEDGEKEEVRKNDKKRKMDKCLKTSNEKSSIFNNVQIYNMTDPCILTTSAFRLIEKTSRVAFRKVLLTFVIFAGNLNF